MSERRHHTKLKREQLALMKRYDLDELAFKTGVSKTTLWNAMNGRELRQKTREKILAWTAKENARDLKALKGSHLDVWRSRDGRCIRFLLVITADDAKRAEFEEIPTYSIAHSPFDSLTEWLNTDEGWEKCSEPLRDAIFSGWFDTKYDQIEGGIAARNALMTLEECHGATWTLDMQEIEKQLKKVSKIRLAKMAWSRGFQAGLMAAERIRVELEEKTKNGWTPW